VISIIHIDELLKKAVLGGASDIHITSGIGAVARVNSSLVKLTDDVYTGEHTLYYTKQILSEKEFKSFSEVGEYDCSYAISGLSRFRVNVYCQRGACAIAIRVVNDVIPTIDSLKLPPIMKELAKKPRGLILVTGPTGSGKSTSLAAMIDYINVTRNSHIITIEDPIEYIHQHKSCVINQRQIGKDSMSFANALRGSLRQDPDIILVGEMRDLETISIALTAAETGHLVLSTLHTIGAAKTIDRIIDVFEPSQQPQVKVQLATVVEAIISQQLLPRVDVKGRVAAFEIMVANPPIRALIREGKTHQMQSVIQTSAAESMITMDAYLMNLFRQKMISEDELLSRCVDADMVKSEIPYCA